MNKTSLFRHPAKSNSQSKLYGAVCINVPAPISQIVTGLGLVFMGFLAYSLLTVYTEHELVRGYLNAKSALIKVFPMQSGIIRQQFKQLGDRVKRGEPLYQIDSSYDHLAQKESREYRVLKQSLKQVNQDIQMKAKHLQALKKLVANHYLAEQSYQQLHDEYRAIQSRRDEIKMNLIRYQQTHQWVVRAPLAGRISSIEYTLGQAVNPNKALMSLMPEPQTLVAQLYIPAAKARFMHSQDPITLRYDAYPYLQFATATARIQSLTHTILSDKDEEKPFDIGEPYYKAIATLDNQTLNIHQQHYPLEQGMSFIAVLSGSKKTIWHWIWDPIFF